MISIMFSARSVARAQRWLAINCVPTSFSASIRSAMLLFNAEAISLMRCEMLLTSWATTAKPLPYSPARPASIKALSAKILVVRMTFWISETFMVARSETSFDRAKICSCIASPLPHITAQPNSCTKWERSYRNYAAAQGQKLIICYEKEAESFRKYTSSRE